eukprot:CAMPEP_0183445876 /NCGR_PEP_ID=MMETSP0370-20130417/96588_1 /TAXON_ID=268820 /ORGANISM="Peridinium aciculiferum, Strain PAER-2" /LENGTH=76 /DNA_ID=CAMNT_0025636527 /DNA_START=138 /DNA_END=365 /DNA_ORIENTATION=+
MPTELQAHAAKEEIATLNRHCQKLSARKALTQQRYPRRIEIGRQTRRGRDRLSSRKHSIKQTPETGGSDWRHVACK